MKYEVIRKNIPYKLDSDLCAKETVVINFLDDDDEVSETKEFGYLSKDELLTIMNQFPDFKLRNLYFMDFSINEYRELFSWHESILKSFYAEKCFFDGDSDFKNINFGKDGFSLAYSFFGNGKIEFEKSTFLSEAVYFNGIRFGNGEKDFSFLRFYGKDINFYGTQFGDGKISFRGNILESGHLNFSGATFGRGNIDFGFSIFGINGVDFSGANFGEGDVSFINVNFNNGDIIFFGSSLELGKLSFSGAAFGNSNIDFSFSTYNNCNIHFRYVVLGSGKFNMSNINLEKGMILFKAVEFKGKPISFAESNIYQLICRDSLFTEHVNMTLKTCSLLTLENCIIEKTFDLASSTKRSINIQCLNILNTKNLGQIYIDWRMNAVKNMIYSQGITTNYQEKANQFRLLKENFRNIGRYNDEDLAYLEFKRCESVYKLKGENLPDEYNRGIKKLKRYTLYPFKWFLLDFVGHYATNPFRIMWTMLITIVTFAGIYMMPFVSLHGNKFSEYSSDSPLLQRLLQSLYHSIATILTIGYGDVNPGNVYAMLLSGFEGFIGVFLMSYFTVAFVRKILR
ncbi:two pore domain potassium channel family protein [Clostridium sp. YIM B02505]|uniref:Two pore domain potassium channel family protein n=1 Tax=Clostridium yunnanense TaxID=2800325 RepID=A0ABS1EM13_9CLOT|nr:potassium channel family protein [Clostridium yunnanense]MBK1810411.1 two pore domain potassium channel family protein [Clostridium yunnanense]